MRRTALRRLFAPSACRIAGVTESKVDGFCATASGSYPGSPASGATNRHKVDSRTKPSRRASNWWSGRRTRRRGESEGEVSFKRLTAFLVVGVLTSVACPLSVAAAATSSQRTRSYPLPSDGWKPGQAAMQGISSAPFQATLTQSRTCTSSAHVDYLWPAGYRVRFHPTVLLDPRGQVVAHQGQYVAVGGGIVGTGSWPSAARCYKGGDVWAVQGPVRVGRPGQLAP